MKGGNKKGLQPVLELKEDYIAKVVKEFLASQKLGANQSINRRNKKRFISIPEFVNLINSDYAEYQAEMAYIQSLKDKKARDEEIMRLKKIPGGLADKPW